MVNLVDLHTLPDRKQQQEIELPPNGTSLNLLQLIYRNSQLPLATRMRAAMACLPMEHPRLAVVAQVNDQSFAEMLERAIKRTAEMENGRTKVIDAPRDVKPVPQIEAPRPKPHVVDRRYRRV